MTRVSSYILLALLYLAVNACSKDTPPGPPDAEGRVAFQISHMVDALPLEKDQLIYVNAARNSYLVSGLKYFISDITFYKPDGATIRMEQWKDIFYIDEDIPSSKMILFYDPVPVGSYDSISFIFGFTAEKNQSYMYINPPEVNMFWPEILGGGYHYLMLDGKWKDSTGSLQPFNFHLGIGQLYHGTGYETDSIYAFVHNHFRVSLSGSSFTMGKNDTITFHLRMNISSWFETPFRWDFNYWGGAIMQNQEAMQMAVNNGMDVFSIQPVTN